MDNLSFYCIGGPSSPNHYVLILFLFHSSFSLLCILHYACKEKYSKKYSFGKFVGNSWERSASTKSFCSSTTSALSSFSSFCDSIWYVPWVIYQKEDYRVSRTFFLWEEKVTVYLSLKWQNFWRHANIIWANVKVGSRLCFHISWCICSWNFIFRITLRYVIL